MAQYNTPKQERVYATDREGMLEDAVEYAKRDIKLVLKVFDELDLDTPSSKILKTLVKIKYEQIKTARLNRDDRIDEMDNIDYSDIE